MLKKGVAGRLAWIGGIFGLDYFYVGKVEKGWRNIETNFWFFPIIVHAFGAFFRGLGYFCMSKESFDKIYNK